MPLQQQHQRKNTSYRRKDKRGKDEPLVALCPNISFLHPLVGRSYQTQGTTIKSSAYISSDSLVGSKSSDSQLKSLDTQSQSAKSSQEENTKTAHLRKSMAKIDTWGCVHLGAADFVFALMFLQPCCEVWDLRDE